MTARIAVLMYLAFSVPMHLRAADPLRAPWQPRGLLGSPEPPLPFVLERAFDLEFSGPVSINRYPDSSVFLVLENDGKIFAFDAEAPDTSHLLVDFNEALPPHSQIQGLERRRVQLYSIAFHPKFAQNRQVYVCYITNGPGAATDTHIARFIMPNSEPQADSLQIDVQSEQSVLVCEGGGHNGCTLVFGPNDGYLYISIGDLEVPTPPDPRDTGQDISDLYASILRIDVDGKSVDATGQQLNYAIPADNPFVDLAGARPEVYAYGLRNPWRMAFDHLTGDLWVGDVGWEAWEMVYRVRSGGNYGWAIKEGPGDVKPQQPGPTPILPPDIALGHAEAASVTGGMVYRGSKFPQLAGKYIFGDWITRKFWAASFDAQQVLATQEIATSNVKPICFELDHHGELLILEYNEANQAAGIFRLAPNTAKSSVDEFPRQISQVGLFGIEKTTGEIRPAEGVFTYEINAPMWADGAEAVYHLAVPGDEKVKFYQQPQKTFNWFRTRVTMPIGSVLAKTYFLTAEASQIPVETQLSVKDAQGEWQYYSYRWNSTGTDAELVGAAGETQEWLLPGSRGGRQSWNYASRGSCRICHTPWTGETVGFIEEQLRAGRASDSWHALQECGVIETDGKTLDDSLFSGLVDPHAAAQPLDRRARSYLHTNCAHCHMNGGNASTVFGLNFDLSLHDSKMIDVMPLRGDLGLQGANIVTAGKPNASVLLFRMAKSGSGHMPHVGTFQIDQRGVELIRQWIAGLPGDSQQRNWLDTLTAPRTRSRGDAQRLEAASGLLKTLPGALLLSAAMASGAVPADLQPQIVDAAMLNPAVGELFEAYAAPGQLPQRLGEHFAAAQVLDLQGDVTRGQALFASGSGTCISCHRVGSLGKELGPDFGQSVAKYQTAEKLLEQVMQPSKFVDEKYRAVTVLTTTGMVVTGRIINETEESISLVDSQGQTIVLLQSAIEDKKPSTASMMPENLLSTLTAQQAADLLAFLLSLAPDPS
ncbi:MAG: PQQ-dependent sugar dehydrogenase [Pirellulaceae bacterium]